MKTHLLLLLLLLFTIIVNAQFTITGKVVDEQNEPLPFVSILVKKTNIGTATDHNGEFSLSFSREIMKIKISSLGFASQQIKVNSKTKSLIIILKEENNQLDEIIIAAKQRKRVKKKQNPAYRILKEVWSRKRRNGLKLVDNYEYKQTKNTEIGLNNLDSTFLKDLLRGNYKSRKEIIDQLPHNETNVNYYIPFF